MDNQTLKAVQTADAAEAAKDNAAAALGKFKDVKALMDAYTELEAEFTRRSQRLKELENANKAEGAPAQAATAPAPSQATEESMKAFYERATGDEIVKRTIISEYLADVAAHKGVPFVTGGVNVAAQKRAPATVKEAGRLAKNYFIKREDNT